MISHSLNDVFAVSDRIIVLRLGRRVATFQTADATTEAVVSAITGADVQLPHEERDHEPPAIRRPPAVRRARPALAGAVGGLPPPPGPGRPRQPAGAARPAGRRRLLPAAERPLPLGRQPHQPHAADRRRRHHLGRASCWCCCSARSTCRSARSAASPPRYGGAQHPARRRRAASSIAAALAGRRARSAR